MKQIIFRQIQWNLLTKYLFKNKNIETGAYALYKTSSHNLSLKLLVTDILIPQNNDYHKRSSAFVSFKPDFTEKVFQKCENTNSQLLDIHTHPWSSDVEFSAIDNREALNSKIPYMKKYVSETLAAFIVLGQNQNIAKARYWDHKNNDLASINRIIVI